MQFSRIWLTLVSLPFFIGCNSYILITKQSTSAVVPNSEADVTSSAAFEHNAHKIKTIAYRPPDTCLNQGAAQADGLGREKQNVMQTSCGVWLKELERAFVGAGYNVTSWQTLIPVGQNTISGDAFIETAKSRNVDVVFLVNSLTIDEINPAKEFQSVTTFQKADKNGTPLADYSANPLMQSRLLSLVPPEAALPAKQEAATFDVTAIDVQTAQAIWFYRQTVTDDYQTQFNWSRLVRCNSDACVPIAQPSAGESSVPAPPSSASSIVTNTRMEARSENDMQRHRQDLIRKTVQNFIAHFSSPARPAVPVVFNSPTTTPTAIASASAPPPLGDPTPTAATEAEQPEPETLKPVQSEQVTAAACAKIDQCDAALLKTHFDTLAKCNIQFHAQIFGASCREYNGSRGAECIRATNAMSCADYLDVLNNKKPNPPSCTDMCKK